MSDLFDVGLFHAKLKYREETCSVIAQLYFQFEKNALSLVMIKSGDPESVSDSDYFALLQVGVKRHEFEPIYNRYADRILEIIKKIPDKKYLSNVNFGYIGKKTGKYVKVNSRLYVAVVDSLRHTMAATICIQLDNLSTIEPLSFCHIAYDGMDKRIYFEIESNTIIDKKEYHALDGVYVCRDFNQIDVFHPYLINHENKISIFFCYSQVYMKSKNTQLSRIYLHNLNVFESMGFLIKKSGFTNWKMDLPEDYPVQFLWYTVTIPILNLTIEDDFGIGNVRFTNNTNLITTRFKNYIPSNSTENSPKTFATIYVNSENFFDAFNLGKLQIQQSLDFLINLARDDSVLNGHAAFDKLSHRQLLDLEPVPILDTWISIEIPFYDKSIIFDNNNASTIKKLNIRHDLIEQIKNYEKIELDLIASIEKTESNVVPLFNAMKWVRKAWDSSDSDDKIIYSVIALEFVVGDESTAHLISKPHRKILKKILAEKIQEIDGERKDIDEYIEKVHKGFDYQFTSSPFMVKLGALISRLSIPVSESHLELIIKARDIRNKIVHGGVINSLSSDDIRLLCEVISQIVLYKMVSLEPDKL